MGSEPVIYSSINYTLSVLNVNYGTLMSYVKFGYLYGRHSGPKTRMTGVPRSLGNLPGSLYREPLSTFEGKDTPNSLILSLNPLTLEEQSRYVAAPLSSSSYQLYIEVYNALGNLLHTAESARQLHT